MTADHQLTRTAARLLDIDDFAVWTLHHHLGYGRRKGARELGISQDAWRWRLARANRIMEPHLARKENAA